MSEIVHAAALMFALAGSVLLARSAGNGCGGRDGGERATIGFTVLVGWWTLGAYALGLLGWLASPVGWLVWISAGALAAFFLERRFAPKWAREAVSPFSVPEMASRWSRVARLVVGKPYLGLAFLLLAWVVAANLALLFWPAPNSFDAMLYHLTRVAYYLQQGSFDAYGANQFSQEQLARGSAALLCGLYSLGGRSDVVAGWPQFVAWCVTGGTVYALARAWRIRPSAAAFAGACWMLLSVAWLEATTAQNDVLIAAHVVASLLYLRRWNVSRRGVYLVLAGAAFGLAVGTKASALTLLPALALANGPALWRPRVVLVAGLASLLFVLPSGYVDNALRHGHPLGSEAWTEHVSTDRSPVERLKLGVRNAVRFAFDACTLDQVPPFEEAARSLARAKARFAAALEKTPFSLERPGEARMPFWRERLHRPDENLSYFGPFGLTLLVGVCVACATRTWRWAGVACLAFVAFQCLAGPYDLIRGRQFLYGAAFVLPAFAWLLGRAGWRGRAFAALFVALAALHIAPAALLRNNHLFVPTAERPAFWQLDRLAQMTSLHATYPAQRAFDEKVPSGARVGVGLQGYEYPLFGYRHARVLVPVRRLAESGRPFPANLDWLVFTPGPAALEVRPGDEDLGSGWYLRRLGARGN